MIVAYKTSDPYELTIGVYRNIKEAIKKLELAKATVYYNKRTIGSYQANGITLLKLKEE